MPRRRANRHYALTVQLRIAAAAPVHDVTQKIEGDENKCAAARFDTIVFAQHFVLLFSLHTHRFTTLLSVLRKIAIEEGLHCELYAVRGCCVVGVVVSVKLTVWRHCWAHQHNVELQMNWGLSYTAVYYHVWAASTYPHTVKPLSENEYVNKCIDSNVLVWLSGRYEF